MTDEQPEFVHVRNVGDRPFTDGYNNRRYTIPVGGSAIVPREAAYLWFGEGPHFVKDPVTTRDRNAEYERVRGRLGCAIGSDGADGRWESVRPRVEVAESDGTRWVLVGDDPAGDTLPDDVTSAHPSLEAQVQMLQRQLQRLQGQIGGEGPQGPQVQVPEDRPDPVRRRAGQAKATVPLEVEQMLDEVEEQQRA